MDNEKMLSEISGMPNEFLTEVTGLAQESARPQTLHFEPAPAPAANPNLEYQGQRQESMNIGDIIDAPVAVELIDIAVSGIGSATVRMLGIDCKKSELAASAKEKEALIKPTRAMLNSLNVKAMTPMEAFLAAILTIYLSKVAIVYMDNREAKSSVKMRETLSYHEDGTPVLLPSGRVQTRKAGETRGRKPKS